MRLASLALAVVCAAIGLLLPGGPSSPGMLARASYDSYFRWFDLWEGAPPAGPVVIVYLDLESHLRERQDPAKPWPRASPARLLQRLKAADNVTIDAAAVAKLEGAQAGEFVVLMVSDTGTGMTPEVRARLFEPFFTTKADGKGTGLGLSTTARLVKAHGGFIAVQSQPGEGTTFEVYLPRLANVSRAEIRPAEELWPRGNGETILIAEDDAAARELLWRTLEEHGYRVLATANGAEAIAAFREHSSVIALALCDTTMPVLDGPQAAAEMRKVSPRLPVLLMGGDTVGSGTSAGIEFLAKPAEIPILLGNIARLLARAGAHSPNSASA